MIRLPVLQGPDACTLSLCRWRKAECNVGVLPECAAVLGTTTQANAQES